MNRSPPSRKLRLVEWALRVVGLGLQVVIAVAVPLVLVMALLMDGKPEEAKPPEKSILIRIDASIVQAPPGPYCKGDKADILVVYSDDLEKGTFATATGSGWLQSTLRLQRPGETLQLSVTRDKDDAGAAKFAAALSDPETVYLSAEPSPEGCAPPPR